MYRFTSWVRINSSYLLLSLYGWCIHSFFTWHLLKKAITMFRKRLEDKQRKLRYQVLDIAISIREHKFYLGSLKPRDMKSI